MKNCRAGNLRRTSFNPTTVEGATKWLYQPDEDGNGVCCGGPHVFGYNIALDNGRHVVDWLWNAIYRAPEDAWLRITVEPAEP